MTKKNKKDTSINFVYKETFKTNIPNPTEEELKAIFNKKYFNYIQKQEKRKLGGSHY